jgi:hypothetical protein
MSRFIHSGFGRFLAELSTGLFTRPSQRSFFVLALGWALSSAQHTVSGYLWLSAGVLVKHFSRFYVFLGAPFRRQLEPLWQRLLARALLYVPPGEPVVAVFDETVSKKSGRKIEGLGYYRNGAGSARQEYRTLRGVQFVIGILLIRLPQWPEQYLALPFGIEVCLKAEEAKKLKRPQRSCSVLARGMLERLCRATDRRVLSIQDGGYATKEFLRGLPAQVQVVGRMLKSGVLYEWPAPRKPGQRGATPKKGKRIGSAKDLARKRRGWHKHPREAGAEYREVEGLWHSVLPGVVLRVVVVRRKKPKRPQQELEVFFTTDLSLSAEQILDWYRVRWSVEIEIRAAKQHYGLGQERCRRLERIEGINNLRLFLAAARLLWFAEQVQNQSGTLDLVRLRSWYRQKTKPTPLDVQYLLLETLQREGITPTTGFGHDVDVFPSAPAPPEYRRAA